MKVSCRNSIRAKPQNSAFDRDESIAAARAFLTESGNYRLGELNEGLYVDSTLTAFQEPSVREAMSRTIDGPRFEEPLLLLAPCDHLCRIVGAV